MLKITAMNSILWSHKIIFFRAQQYQSNYTTCVEFANPTFFEAPCMSNYITMLVDH
jgi:hypothetical protein